MKGKKEKKKKMMMMMMMREEEESQVKSLSTEQVDMNRHESDGFDVLQTERKRTVKEEIMDCTIRIMLNKF